MAPLKPIERADRREQRINVHSLPIQTCGKLTPPPAVAESPIVS
jgi:hypothetical protein